MFTSRAEYRLLLREDNADARLTEMGRKIGLVDEGRWRAFCEKMELAEKMRQNLLAWKIPSECATSQTCPGAEADLPVGKSMAEVLTRPDITLKNLVGNLAKGGEAAKELARRLNEEIALNPEAAAVIETDLKYGGYLKKQAQRAEKKSETEKTALPRDMEYRGIAGLSREVEEKLTKTRPATLGQAARISGVTPAAIACLEIHLHKMGLLGKHGQKSNFVG